jgi:hypothetical protein
MKKKNYLVVTYAAHGIVYVPSIVSGSCSLAIQASGTLIPLLSPERSLPGRFQCTGSEHGCLSSRIIDIIDLIPAVDPS